MINKSLNMPVVLSEELTMEKLLSVFGLGNEIVFIIQDGKRFIGGITQGDFKRALKNGVVKASEIINTKMHKIVLDNEIDENYLKNKAGEIFHKYSLINNIPVVDINGNLCFQYEREKDALKNRIRHYLNLADESLVFEAFFQCYKNLNIVITGADTNSLNEVKDFFEKKYKQVTNEPKESKISILTLSECSLLETESVIITITPFCKTYLESNSAFCRAKIILLESLGAYRNYHQVYKILKQDLLAWIQLFGYEEIVFMEHNTYTIYIKSVMECCGIDVKFFDVYQDELLKCQRSGAELLLSSCNGKYIEEISFDRFLGLVKLIGYYYRICGVQFQKTNYIIAFNQILKAL